MLKFNIFFTQKRAGTSPMWCRHSVSVVKHIHIHRSSNGYSTSSGHAAQMFHWGESALPCLQSFQTLGDSSAGFRPPWQTLQRGEKCKIYSPISSMLIHFCHALGRIFKELRKRCLIRGWSQRKLNQPVFSKKQVFLRLTFSPCPKIKFFKSGFVESKFSKLQCPDPVAPRTEIASERTHIVLLMI